MVKKELLDVLKNPVHLNKFLTYYKKNHTVDINAVLTDPILCNTAVLDYLNGTYGIHINYTSNSFFIFYIIKSDYNKLTSYTIRNTDVIIFKQYEELKIINDVLTDALIYILELIIKPF